MSEIPDARAAGSEDATMSSQSPSAGTLLRQAREAAGLHIGALSVALKVPVKKLEALEADRHDLLPDAVFARALAASVCRTLKIDPGPVLNRLPEQVMPRLTLDSSTSDRASLHPPRALWHASLLDRLPKPVLVVAGLLVVAAIVLFFLPSVSDPVATGPGAVEGVAASGTIASPALPLVTAPAPAPLPAEAAASATPAPPVPAPVAAVSMPAAATDSAASPPPVLFKAKGVSWVEVTDAAGAVRLRKVLNPGEALPVAGVLPLAVVVGRADAVDVVVRGQPFDLVPVARDNVARFQIK